MLFLFRGRSEEEVVVEVQMLLSSCWWLVVFSISAKYDDT
jgi:hypothetical protein